MIERLLRHAMILAGVACSLTLLGCGSDTATLEIVNDHGEGAGTITQLRIRECTAGSNSGRVDARPVTIAFGESYDLELAPGCHLVSVSRDGATSTARVRLDAGDSAEWVPFRIDDVEEDDWEDGESSEDDDSETGESSEDDDSETGESSEDESN